MTFVHPTAIVDDNARLGDDVTIGPYCTIGPDVELGDGVTLKGHVVVDGHTRLEAGCVVHPFAAVGTPPQDMKYSGEPSELIVGAGTVIREHVTLNTGTEGGGMETRIGRNCLLMIGSHIAHDCRIGDGVIMANNATLGGHVVVEDQAFLGGLVAVHQFARIGRGAMIGGMTGVENDVIPYALAMGNRARLNGLNVVGLKRRGLDKAEIHSLRAAYHMLFGSDGGTFETRRERVAAEYGELEPVQHILAFIDAGSHRSLCQPKVEHAG